MSNTDSSQCSLSQTRRIANLLAVGVRVEVIWPHVSAEHDVIVEVDELVGQAWDAVQMRLNRRRRERRKVTFVRE